MKVAYVEPFAKRLLGSLPEGFYLEFAQFVRERLRGPGNVSVNLRAYVVQCQRRVRRHVVHGLLPSPAFCMHAGIHHKPTGAPHLVTQPAKVAVGIRVEARFQTQPLGVQTPTFPELCIPRKPATHSI